MSQQINLYNPIFLKQEKYFSARTMAQALGLIAAGIAALCLYAAYQTSRLDAVAAGLDKQLGAERARLIQLGEQYSPRGATRQVQAEVTRLEARVRAGEQLLASLRSGELGNASGFSQYLGAFARQALPGVWLTGFVIGASGDELIVQGRVLQADLVPKYLRALSREDVMRGRSVTELKLTARDEGAPKPPAAGAPAAQAAAGPARYVEFSMNAPLKVPETARAPAPGGKS
jgi:Tfp pilus assembly protein PilN